MNATLIAIGVLALGVTALVALGAFFVHKWLDPHITAVLGRYVDGEMKVLREAIVALQYDVSELPRRWEEIKSETQRLRDRATYHVRRARSELASVDLEDPELEALALDLRAANGERGEEVGVQPVPDAVETVPPAQEDPIMAALRYKWAKNGL